MTKKMIQKSCSNFPEREIEDEINALPLPEGYHWEVDGGFSSLHGYGKEYHLARQRMRMLSNSKARHVQEMYRKEIDSFSNSSAGERRWSKDYETALLPLPERLSGSLAGPHLMFDFVSYPLPSNN